MSSPREGSDGGGESDAPDFFDPSLIENSNNADDIITSSFTPMKILRSKVVVVGDAESGKTSLIKSFLSGSGCAAEYTMTTDVELSVGKVPVADCEVDLFLYDVPGHAAYDRERQLLSHIWDGASYLVCCYDVSSRESFENCSKWIRLAGSADARVLIVANKADLREDVVEDCDSEEAEQEGKRWAADRKYEYFECGAFESSSNAALPFQHMAQQTYETYAQRREKLAKVHT